MRVDTRSESNTKYEQQPYRFVIITIYIAAAIVNSLPVHTFSAINVKVERTFDINEIYVTMNALLFSIIHPIFAFPANWFINRYGMKKGFWIGGIFIILGVWLRILIANKDPIGMLAGSFFAAIGNIFVLNTPSKVAFNWFSSQKVPLITFAGVLATLISITLGASIPGLVIGKNPTQDQIRFFLIIEAIIVTIPMIVLMVFFRQKPTASPSKAAGAVETKQRLKYGKLLKQLFKNPQYIKLLLCMTFNYGTQSAFIMILDQGLEKIGYKQNSGTLTAVCIGCAMVFGIISTPIFSILIRRTKRYKLILSYAIISGFIFYSLIFLLFFERIQLGYELIIVSCLFGIFMIPISSLIISYASEVVYPLDQGSSAGYLYAGSQTFGFIIGFGGIILIGDIDAKIIFITYAGFFLLSLVMNLLTKENLKKFKFQQLRDSLLKQSQANRQPRSNQKVFI